MTMFRTFTGSTTTTSSNPGHTDTRRQIGAAVGIGLTLATQFSHATHHPFDPADPVRELAHAMQITNSSSVAVMPSQVVFAGFNCGMPLAPHVMAQYGLTPQAVLNPSIVGSNCGLSRWTPPGQSPFGAPLFDGRA
jgi:hypothetical protein